MPELTLLTDEEPRPVAELQSYGLKKLMGREYMGMMRHTFVIDAEGNLEKIYLKVKAATMADTLLNDLDWAEALHQIDHRPHRRSGCQSTVSPR